LKLRERSQHSPLGVSVNLALTLAEKSPHCEAKKHCFRFLQISPLRKFGEMSHRIRVSTSCEVGHSCEVLERAYNGLSKPSTERFIRRLTIHDLEEIFRCLPARDCERWIRLIAPYPPHDIVT
jgi:hypothetical protein